MVGEGDRWKASERNVLNQGKLKTIEALLIPRTLGLDCSFPSLLYTTTAEWNELICLATTIGIEMEPIRHEFMHSSKVYIQRQYGV